MKNKRKFIILIVIVILVAILIKELIQIYAVFFTEVAGNVNLENGIWKIEVNETEITEGTDVEFDIEEFTTVQNSHVKVGKFAPGLSGSFIIEIDPKNTDVAVRYDITLDQEQLEDTALNIKSITETRNSTELIQTQENTYTGVISLDEITNSVTEQIAVEVEWIDDDSNGKHDAELASTYNNKLSIPVKVHVIQYTGEEISEYSSDEE